MFTEESNDYTFNASALGVGGYFTRNGRRVLVPSLASVALPPGGGEGWAREQNYDRDGIAFTHAESRVVGYETSPGIYTTYSDILVTNLSVLNRVRVAMLQATVTSTRDIGCPEPKFELHAVYRGVEIDGIEVIPRIDINVCQSSNYLSLAQNALPAIAACDARSLALAQKRQLAISRGEPIRTSIISDIEANHQDAQALLANRHRNVLDVQGLGRIHFGELLVKPGRRRVNLLRFEFGRRLDFGGMQVMQEERVAETNIADDSMPVMHTMKLSLTADSKTADSGSLTVGSGDGNGAPVWPSA
ncbi:MAG: hypothetical protein M3Q69_14635 [Acidobacteriota bacterium]|nr:hypothetical protein [Acidobacteriota bacterium]